MKEYIKALVKEGLGGLIKEKSKTPEKDDGKKKKKAIEKNRAEQDQQSIKNAAASDLAPPESHIMAAAKMGDPDSATDRADFNKQLNQTHGRGFSEKDKAKVSTVLNSLNLMK